MTTATPDTVLDFWFREIPESAWWEKDTAFDAALQQRFGDLYRAATRGELFAWRDSIRGRLAEIIVLDQFSRNLFRDQAAAFAFDSMALALSQEAVRTGHATGLPPKQRAFLYMPFMHSESPAIHDVALQLFAEDGMAFNLDFEKRHKAIIDRFGRYPHRNAVLGRASTPEETAFLQTPGSSF